MKDDIKLPKKLIFVALLVFALWLGWGLAGTTITGVLKHDASLAAAGQWGDSFGVLNALVSTFGFIGFLAAFLIQGETLKLQQADSVAARQEQHQQRFESSFFQLLDLLRELRSQIEFSPSNDYRTLSNQTTLAREHKGYDAIATAAAEVNFWVAFNRRKIASWTKELFVSIYESRVHNQSEGGLGAYFRVIYTLLRKISEDQVLTQAEKDWYGNLVRSQLTSEELVLIGMNGLSTVSNNFSRYIEEFRLLKYVPHGPMRDGLEVFYVPTTFLARD
ncbi:hypothetical protein HFO32_10845 [Rhizobium leguminosarum]|uniref:putative phage abortive infection protein n=1 Tax=Rhizobium leguminosarum TaxID=384 RepID=UPI001C95A5E2|nr:putative phage abortive infection protein [Rhizobium leguminosarum]MBY5682654.1 hypothetical protein [Rhizobium leguminosarum]